ncbi:MAG: RnfH family protein [Acidiferrobacterales bacterium]
MSTASKSISVQVVYATPEKQVLKEITVSEHATVEMAITSSGLLEEFPEIDLLQNDVGVFSERRQLSDVVHAGDRVEIYRPLVADPKEMRRRRAREASNKR